MFSRRFPFLGLLFVALFLCLAIPATAKDQWLKVRSKNFLLIGNASEKDIRKVATKLEQFRETFKQIFEGANLTSTVPTNVVVFKSDASYRPFKPKRDDGRIDDYVAGYFQSGEAVNYITLSTEGTESQTYGTIFHEYVHFVIDTNFGKSDVPAWFNEGLAEYYQTFEIEGDTKVKLGLPQSSHLALLHENQLIPFANFFHISTSALNQHEDHSRNLFYAQAWALIHYLMQTNRTSGLGKFLKLTMANKPAEQAFQEAFGTGYVQMESDLRKYVEQGTYKYHVIPLKSRLAVDAGVTSTLLTDAESNAYLGDLLYHVGREEDAEPFLQTALSLKPDLSMANLSFAMIKLRQRKFDEAKRFLEKAIASEQDNHLALYRYAYLLTRENRDEFGYVGRFDSATATKIRELLRKSIAIDPSFTESYELLAFVNLVNNEELDEAAALLQKAIKQQPGNMRYAMRLAEVEMRRDRFQESTAIAEKIAKTTDQGELRIRADRVLSEIKRRQEVLARNEEFSKRYGEGGPAYGRSVGEQILIRRKPGEERPTAAEIAAAQAAARLRGINQSLRPLGADETRVIGWITKITCGKNDITYSVRTETGESFILSSKDFSSLVILTFVSGSRGKEVGCDSTVADARAVLTYRQAARAKIGELKAIEFVPADFRFIDLATEPKPPTYVIEEVGPPPTEGEQAQQRRASLIRAIRDNLRSVAAGETRGLGYLERTECSAKGIFFYLRSGEQTIKLANDAPESMHMRAFTPDVENLKMGCGLKGIDVPVVFVYRGATDPKSDVAGELVSLEFVPRAFTLN